MAGASKFFSQTRAHSLAHSSSKLKLFKRIIHTPLFHPPRCCFAVDARKGLADRGAAGGALRAPTHYGEPLALVRALIGVQTSSP